MSGVLPPMRLTGAVCLRGTQMQERSVVIEDGRISKGPRPAVDLRGYMILPGIIDLHAVLPGFDEAGLRDADQSLARHGVTTAWASVPWENPIKTLTTLNNIANRPDRNLTDLRLQLRCDPGQLNGAEALIQTVRRGDIGQVLFTPSRDEGHELLPHVVRQLCQMAEAFDLLGVQYGTLGDPSAERRERYAMIGARLSLLPGNRRPAAAAFAMGDPVFLSAPEVEKDACFQGNIPVRGLIRDRLIRGMVSGGVGQGLAGAALALWRAGLMDLPRAWAMVSAHPAQIMGLPDRGVIDYGKRADLVVINANTHQIEATIRDGALTFLCGEAANRFAEAEAPLRLAAE